LLACSTAPKTVPQQVGQGCTHNEDCAPGLSCQQFLGSEGSCSDEGVACGVSCPSGLTCVDGGEGPGCWHLPRRLGDSCHDPTFSCGVGLTCFAVPGAKAQGNGLSTLACVALDAYRGAPCAGGWECPTELACRFGADGGTCQIAGDGLDTDCSAAPCGSGLGCNQGFQPPRCRPPGIAGEPCFRGGETGLPGSDCAAGLVCNWALPASAAGTGQCADPGSLGSPCLRAEECGSGLSCSSVDGGLSQCG
jgi:hypothetical protein